LSISSFIGPHARGEATTLLLISEFLIFRNLPARTSRGFLWPPQKDESEVVLIPQNLQTVKKTATLATMARSQQCTTKRRSDECDKTSR
jgi:hypothetical protein